MSHVSSNTAALQGGAIGLTDPLLYHVIVTQESMALVPGDGVILCQAIKPLTMSLPRPQTCRGRAFVVMKVDGSANPVTITGQDMHDLVNGVRSVQVTAQFEAKTLLSDGQYWWVVQYSGHAEYPGLPDGGAAGQVLVKDSSAEYDASWQSPHWVPLPAARAVRPRDVEGDAITTITTIDRVVLPGDPLSPLEAATKEYVDTRAQTPGPPGPPGATGPPGPAGTPGKALYTELWTWTVKTTDANTAGQVGVNATTWAAATAVNLNEKTTQNWDVSNFFPQLLVAGGELYVQQKTDATRWARYRITGSVDLGAWWQAHVVFLAGSGAIPGGNADTSVSFLYVPGSIGP